MLTDILAETAAIRSAWWRPYAPNKEDFTNLTEYYVFMFTEYFVTLCQQEGYESLMNALLNWLIEYENDASGGIFTFTDKNGITISRYEYALDIANDISNHLDVILPIMDLPMPTNDSPVMEPEILTIPSTPSNHSPSPPSELEIQESNPEEAQEIIDFEELDAYLLNEFNNMNAIEVARNHMTSTYIKYEELLKQQRKIVREKRLLIEELVIEVNYWSHLSFEEPDQNENSIRNYFAQKYAKLRAILPSIHRNPSLKDQIRRQDSWGNKRNRSRTFEDELSFGGGICNTQEQNGGI